MDSNLYKINDILISMKYRALLFDADGVLVDSERTRFNFFQKTFKREGLHLPDKFFYQMVGKSTPVFFQEIAQGQQFDESILKKVMDEYYKVFKPTYPQQAVLIRATVDFILQYSGQSKFGVATVNSKEKTLELLCFLNINTIVGGIISRDDVINQKPDPEVYLKLSQLLNINPSDCAVIEDTKTGALAGIGAGMDCYIFLNSYNNKDQFSDINIKGYISSQADLNKISL
jgi:beta-phosphoglucomutase